MMTSDFTTTIAILSAGAACAWMVSYAAMAYRRMNRLAVVRCRHGKGRGPGRRS